MSGFLPSVTVAGITDVNTNLINIQRSLSSLFQILTSVSVEGPPGPAGPPGPTGPPGPAGTPGGSSGQVQYNNAGVFGGLTNAALTALVQIFTPSLSGAVPSSPGGTSQVLLANATWGDAPALGSSQSTPADPTGTASTGGVMMGLAGSVTPLITGKVLLVLSGSVFNASSIGDGASVQLRHGTGGAPSNGGSLVGTAVGGQVQYISSTTTEIVPFSLQAVVTGLSTGVAHWIDVGLAAVVGGTANISNVSISAVEVY